MATTNHRTPDEIRSDIEAERNRLAEAVDQLRGEIGEATNVSAKLKAHLPVVAGASAAVGFVLAGGVGATMRFLARRSREGHEKARLGRWELLER
jgi:Protein of unknown function (DUF3618)